MVTPSTSTPTSASDWKKSSGMVARPTKVPSGNTCLMRQPGMDVFIKSGMVPNSLMGIITDAMKTGKEPKFDELVDDADPQMLEDIITMANGVTVYCVVEPRVKSNLWSREDEQEGLCTKAQVGKEILPADRDPEALYVDEVDMDDRLFIFNVAVGGTADVERFREELAAGVVAVRPGKSSPKPTKRTGGASKKRK